MHRNFGITIPSNLKITFTKSHIDSLNIMSPSLFLKTLAELPRRFKAAFLICFDLLVLGFTMMLAFAVRFDPASLEYQLRNLFEGAGSKRTAKASIIVKPNTKRSKQIKNAALNLRGNSAKVFKNKLGDIIFNESMWDFVNVILRFEGIVMPKFLCIFKTLHPFQCYPYLSITKSLSAFFPP
jgi:hypothetical protein